MDAVLISAVQGKDAAAQKAIAARVATGPPNFASSSIRLQAQLGLPLPNAGRNREATGGEDTATLNREAGGSTDSTTLNKKSESPHRFRNMGIRSPATTPVMQESSGSVRPGESLSTTSLQSGQGSGSGSLRRRPGLKRSSVVGRLKLSFLDKASCVS
jgi:hypothetical protein